MVDERLQLFQNVVDAILTSPGETPTSIRPILAQQPSHLYRITEQQETSLAPDMRAYVNKVATSAYKVTDRDIGELCASGYSEDAIFEITLSVAAGAGRMCLTQGLAALKGATHASGED